MVYRRTFHFSPFFLINSWAVVQEKIAKWAQLILPLVCVCECMYKRMCVWERLCMWVSVCVCVFMLCICSSCWRWGGWPCLRRNFPGAPESLLLACHLLPPFRPSLGALLFFSSVLSLPLPFPPSISLFNNCAPAVCLGAVLGAESTGQSQALSCCFCPLTAGWQSGKEAISVQQGSASPGLSMGC